MRCKCRRPSLRSASFRPPRNDGNSFQFRARLPAVQPDVLPELVQTLVPNGPVLRGTLPEPVQAEFALSVQGLLPQGIAKQETMGAATEALQRAGTGSRAGGGCVGGCDVAERVTYICFI